MLLPKTLWIIEDAEDVWPVYDNALNDEQYNLKFFNSFTQFASSYSKQEKSHPDLIVADICLQETDFFKELNESELMLSTPFMIVSNSNDLDTMRNAFQAGAIDYLVKPIQSTELLAKTEKHLTELQLKTEEACKSLDALNLDKALYTNKELRIVESFNLRDEKTLHRSEIVKLIWKNINIHPNTLDVHIYNLRRKLKTSGYGIKSVGNGMFKFIDIN